MTTKAQALDHLTDALAGEDVAGEPTVAGAIDKLATMIEDGDISIGGGGGDGIILVTWNNTGDNEPSVPPADIYAAVEAGKTVIFKYQDNRGVPEQYANFDHPKYFYHTSSNITDGEYEPAYKYHIFSGIEYGTLGNKDWLAIYSIWITEKGTAIIPNSHQITSA